MMAQWQMMLRREQLCELLTWWNLTTAEAEKVIASLQPLAKKSEPDLFAVTPGWEGV
jgi:hypothetical protein